jgi:hypothetical protein
MSKTKLVVVGCFAAFALSALASASASAAWDVNGTLLVGTAALLNSTLVLAHGSLEVVGAGVTLECTAKEIGINGGEIVHPDEIRIKDLTFKSCVANGANCSLAEANILTLPLHGLAELDGKLGVYIKLLPLPSKTAAVLTYEGANCALKGVQPVTGTFDLLAPTGQDPSVLQLANIFSLPGSVKVGSSEGKLSGLHIDLRLASGLTWNFL